MLTAFIFWLISTPVSFLVVGLSNNILSKISKYWPHGQFPHFPFDVFGLLLFPVVNIIVAGVCIISSSFVYIFKTYVSDSGFQKIKNWFNGE